MPSLLVLLAPSANHVYAGQAPRLAATEIALTCPLVRQVSPVRIAGVDYLEATVDELAPVLAPMARASATLALFVRHGDLLEPVELPVTGALDEDLVTIPKYRGKTNEQFTRLLLNVTLAATRGPVAQRLAEGRRLAVLDPMAGRGTTLQTAWLLGHDGFGVEVDAKAVEALSAHMTTWLRHKRLKHTAGMHPVRREGRSLGRRFDAELRLPEAEPLTMGVFTGDTRDSAALWGRKLFDAVVVDAPYGVVHGSTTGRGDRRGPGRGSALRAPGRGGDADRHDSPRNRDRSPAELLAEAVPVWAGQLRPGGAMGISWNTFGMAREDLLDIMAKAGLEPLDDALHQGLEHRVDSSIHRDVAVAARPVG